MELLRRHIAPGAFHNSDERYDPPKCHPHTRKAVLKKIMDWVNGADEVALILWLYGPAGTGKSAIAQTIAELLEEAGLLAAAFFFSRSASGRNNETSLVATLVYQLIISYQKSVLMLFRQWSRTRPSSHARFKPRFKRSSSNH